MHSEKQKIYLEILFIVLPFARNVQTWPFYKRLFQYNLYPELELVHNIPPLLEHEEFRDEDIYWLNGQADNYLGTCKCKERALCSILTPHLKKLVSIVPNDLKDMITREHIKELAKSLEE